MDSGSFESCSPYISVGFGHDPGQALRRWQGGELRRGRHRYREWARRNGRLDDIQSIDDRYDHDVDELMA
jgi:hypothetical protein